MLGGRDCPRRGGGGVRSSSGGGYGGLEGAEKMKKRG